MTYREADRIKVINSVLESRLTWAQAAQQLHLSSRQIGRLVLRVRAQGNRGVIHGLRGQPSNNRTDSKIMKRALTILKDPLYEGFGPVLAQEKLEADKQVAENEKREVARKEQEEKEKINRELQSKRLNEILPYNKYGSDVDMSTLWVLAESHYHEILSEKKAAFEKSESERLENSRIENERKIKEAADEAARKERERIEEENRQAGIKRQQEEARKAEELAKAGDKANWEAFIKNIEAIPHPTLRSGQYRKISAIAKGKIEEILNLRA